MSCKDAWKQEARIRDLEERTNKLEQALFLLGMDYCEYCHNWKIEADMLNGVTFFNGCCKDCITKAYEQEGAELDEHDGTALDDQLAWQFLRRDALRSQHPTVWNAIKDRCKTPEFNRKHPAV